MHQTVQNYISMNVNVSLFSSVVPETWAMGPALDF